MNIPRQTLGALAEIAQHLNPILRRWMGYYGRFSRSAVATLADCKSEAEGLGYA
ncbi:hypothetical protein FDV58_34365 [Bradyrhizobium elkanii]|uniref:Group II intron maturase-specific domain-containing protein n=1 Tax=Bradyrhizobium elkanii TaxID=29448 RepID=A0A4V6CVR9_BRAEL|nr:hypothetical protein FDV58_34365 [Bradyrhizobium elkanii]